MTDASTAQRLFTRWREQVVAAVGQAREELDALNVYPVADRDTGTNVYLTLEAASAAADAAENAGGDLASVGAAFGAGALLGARGSSGTILAQLLRAGLPELLRVADDADPVAAGAALAAALRAGADAAWQAVHQPVAGSMLSVATAAADGATAASGAPLPEVLRASVVSAYEALDRTTSQLEELRRAGVVDAGGSALAVMLDATERVLTGRLPASRRPARPRRPPLALVAESGPGPAYEVMYLLDADDVEVPALRQALAPLGDSLVVVGGAGLWNVHVHVDDVGAAIEAGIAAGRPHRIVVTRFADQDAAVAPTHAPVSRRAVVTTSAGPGLTELFERAGATVVPSEPGHRARTGDFVEAVLGTGAREVVVLPNDARIVAAAEAAARQVRDSGVRAAVIPTRAQVQGLAALAVHDPDRSFDADVVHMSSAAGQTRHAAVTVARERAMTTVGPCEPGDVLGVVDGDFAVVGHALDVVARQVVDRLLGGAGELLTVLSGADAGPDLAAELAHHVSRTRPEVDVVVHEGGQRGYQLLLAVE